MALHSSYLKFWFDIPYNILEPFPAFFHFLLMEGALNCAFPTYLTPFLSKSFAQQQWHETEGHQLHNVPFGSILPLSPWHRS